MLTYVFRRILLAIPTVLLVITFLFLVMRVLPGDAARSLAGISATPEDIENLQQLMGLDKPLFEQYFLYLGSTMRGDLGVSYMTQQPVIVEIASRAGYTITITMLALAIAVPVGIGLGVLAAWKPNSIVDVAVSTLSVIGLSVPVFWAGLLAILVFAVQLQWLPASGVGGPASYILPTLCLALYPLGLIARMMRSSLLETMSADFVRTARSKGATRSNVVFRHGVPNAIGPVVTVAGLQLGSMLGGAVLIETVFGWPGLGRLLVDSILNRDTPVVLGIVLLFSLAFIVINLITDVLYGIIDPRIRFE